MISLWSSTSVTGWLSCIWVKSQSLHGPESYSRTRSILIPRHSCRQCPFRILLSRQSESSSRETFPARWIHHPAAPSTRDASMPKISAKPMCRNIGISETNTLSPAILQTHSRWGQFSFNLNCFLFEWLDYFSENISKSILFSKESSFFNYPYTWPFISYNLLISNNYILRTNSITTIYSHDDNFFWSDWINLLTPHFLPHKGTNNKGGFK